MYVLAINFSLADCDIRLPSAILSIHAYFKRSGGDGNVGRADFVVNHALDRVFQPLKINVDAIENWKRVPLGDKDL